MYDQEEKAERLEKNEERIPTFFRFEDIGVYPVSDEDAFIIRMACLLEFLIFSIAQLYYYTNENIKIRKKVEEQHQSLIASSKLSDIGLMAAGVAHEIGNPLASISSIVQILQRKSSDQFISDQLVNVKDNINRISKIVRELVDLSRPPSHDFIITQINEVVKTAVGILLLSIWIF